MFPIGGFPAVVHDGQYQNVMVFDGIKNCVGKAFGQAASYVFINNIIQKWGLSYSFNRLLDFGIKRGRQRRALLRIVQCRFFEFTACFWVKRVGHFFPIIFRTLSIASMPGMGLIWPLLLRGDVQVRRPDRSHPSTCQVE